MRLQWLLCAVLILASAPAAAQDVRDFGTTMRGRLGRDALAADAAREAAGRAGVACRVTNGLFLGRDAGGEAHYEVACADAPGFIVIGGPPYRTISCLALSERGAGNGGCRLRENADSRRQYARMAASADLDCVVEDGRLVGLGTQGGMVYEIGCAQAPGYWLESSANGWRVTDCLTVAVQGGECRLTSQREQRRGFQARLVGSELATCDVADVRAMGNGGNGAYFEVRCEAGDPVVVRFGEGGGLGEIIPCADAALIGDGCRLGRDTGR